MKSRSEVERLLKQHGFWLERVTKHWRWTNGEIAFSIGHKKQPWRATASMLSVLKRIEQNKPLTPRKFGAH